MNGTTIEAEAIKEPRVIEPESIRAREARAKATDRAATIVIWSLAMLGIMVLALIVLAILWKGIATALNPGFILGKPASFKEAGGGIWPMIVSSFYLAGLTIAMVLPIGIGAAIYMAEYAREGKTTRIVRFGADSLSTVPSIVFGIFGMVLFVIYFGLGYCLLAGAFTLMILNLPTVMRTTEEAIRAVPDSYREASMGLGATKWYTIKKVILPSAVPGITTGAVLTIGRVIGESAAVIYTVGLVCRSVPWSPFQPAAPMAANIYYLFSEGQIVPDWMRIASGEAAFLLVIVLAFTLFARFISWLYKRKTMVSDRFT